MAGKKVVNSNCPEFGYELLSTIPYAYKLHKEGLLQETISGFDTKCLYFFSPKHTELECKRSWNNVVELKKQKFPNIEIHRPELDWNNFSAPPFKEFYKTRAIKFQKETIVIFNRYNLEWGKNPINYLDVNTLEKLFSLLDKKYQIVYLNLNHDKRYFDHFEPMKFNDDEVLNKYPNILTFKKLQKLYPNLTTNEIQLRIFANCEKYISSNGGQLILSAYFGGENIIFSKECNELKPEVNSFYRWYHKLGGGIFQHVDNNNSLIELVTQKWVQNKPLINILVRTSERPIFFKDCITSIKNQTYKNVNIIVGVDTQNTKKYVIGEKCRMIEYDYSKLKESKKPKNSEEYGHFFVPNLYMNNLQNEVKKGYIMYLDDDDIFENNSSLKTIVDNIKTNDDILFWKVKFIHKVIPSDFLFGKPPYLYQIDTMGFMFPQKYKVNWEPFTKGDYRVAKKLYQKIPNKIYIDKILTKSLRDGKLGRGIRDDKILTKPDLTIIIPTFDNPNFLKECLDSVTNSVKNLNCEILVGVDACEKTLNFLYNKEFDDRIKFKLFEKNIGPYIIKNTLVSISKSEKILFFDSDDIMLEKLVKDSISVLNTQKMYKPKYYEFKDVNELKSVGNLNSNKFGEGVFAIDKKTFLSLNGFEGWRCAADSDFMGRFYKRNMTLIHGKEVSFFRRAHPNSLTSSPKTSMTSKLRSHYFLLSKVIRPNGICEKFETHSFIDLDLNSIHSIEFKKTNENDVNTKSNDEIKNNILIKQKEESKKILNNLLNTIKKQKNIDYDVINDVLKNKGVYNPQDSIKKPKEHKPNDRMKLVEMKKDSNSAQIKKNIRTHPDRRENLPKNIFGKNNKRKNKEDL